MDFSIHLGAPELDDAHERIHGLILQLRNTSPSVAVGTLALLRADACAHFNAEDEDLRSMKDGNASCHIDEHAAVLKSLDEVAHALANSAIPEEFKAQLVRRLTDELLRWLPEHVNEMDVAIAAHRTRRRYGGAPMRIAPSRRASKHNLELKSNSP